ncbi:MULTISPECIES: hypothetical protein [Cylindrospermopsis]|uniref:hypothetical protein n=1 Tax=Cylindrospermopsis TaxID=77021 RepID=UPI00070BD865|nr:MULTISPECIES: hypothetical protein [Cylindrospermopsis]KRH97656.1 hypothetical protein ASL19_15020 [Cylindrospermopsis sp. CR12]MBU6346572.1 hypothetical protein [Cyanobacteria bacterium REEB494]
MKPNATGLVTRPILQIIVPPYLVFRFKSINFNGYHHIKASRIPRESPPAPENKSMAIGLFLSFLVSRDIPQDRIHLAYLYCHVQKS